MQRDTNKIFGTSILCAGALFALSSVATAAELPDASISLFLGKNSMKKSDWSPVNDQSEVGAVLDLGRADSVADLVVSYFIASDKASGSIKGETAEFAAGARKMFRIEAGLAPFVEGGLAYISTKVSNGSLSDSDNAVGYWLGAGVNFAVGDRVLVGLEARYSAADVTVFNKDRTAGGTHLGINLGFGL